MTMILDYGPTVAEAALAEMRRCNREIAELNNRRATALQRFQNYRHSRMTEAERIASEAEPFQTVPLFPVAW